MTARSRREPGIATGTPGTTGEAKRVKRIRRTGQADAVLRAREAIHVPYRPLHAAHITVGRPQR